LSVLAVDLGGSHVTCAAVSSGRVLCARTLPSDGRSLAALLPEIAQCLKECCSEARVAIRDCIGIGIGFPAIVDAEAGEVISSFTKYQDVGAADLRTWAQEHFELPR
jgi:predicted NBD/HSP70 family sugar kinase